MSMSDLPPHVRVHTGGREDLAAYRQLIVTSTVSRHSPAIEAVVQVAIAKYKRMHSAYVHFLRNGGSPGQERRSSRWREASEGWEAAQECLAHAMSTIYPSADRALPLAEVQALVQHRVGPLCTGWDDGEGLVHHPAEPCDVHPENR